MRLFCALAVAVWLGGCAVDQAKEPGGLVTESIESTRAVSEARDYFTAEHPDADISDVKAPLWAYVDLDTFKDMCDRPSCATEGVDWHVCAHACTRWFDNGQIVSVYGGPAAKGVAPISEPVAQAHETMHVFEWATTGNTDEHHTDAAIWVTAMHWVSTRLDAPSE